MFHLIAAAVFVQKKILTFPVANMEYLENLDDIKSSTTPANTDP